jgi:hypothetical protein
MAWVDERGQRVTDSPYKILKAAECLPTTPAVPRLPGHHELVACPCCSALPTGTACALRRLTKGNDLHRGFGESLARYLDMAFKTGKHCALPGERRSCLQTQDKTRAALRASVLRQQEHARSAPLRSSAVAEPRRQRYARDVLRRNASQVQHDCTESIRLRTMVGPSGGRTSTG